MRVEQRLLRRGGPHDAPTESEDSAQPPRNEAPAPGSAELIQTQVAVLVLIELRFELRAMSPTRRSSLPAFREDGSARGVRPDVPARVAAQLERLNIDGAEPYLLGRAVRALKPVNPRARLRNLLAPGHGGSQGIGAARCCSYGFATGRLLELLVYRPMQPRGRSQLRVVVCRLVQLRG